MFANLKLAVRQRSTRQQDDGDAERGEAGEAQLEADEEGPKTALNSPVSEEEPEMSSMDKIGKIFHLAQCEL